MDRDPGRGRPLAGKLTGAEKNDAQSWLPAKAESTKVLDLQSRFQSPNMYPAVVVYDRPSGLTAADRAKAAARRREASPPCPRVVRGQVLGPFVARDGRAIETVVPVNLGKNGWNAAGTAADAIRGIAQANAHGVAVHIAGPAGHGGRLGQGVQGDRRHAAVRHAGGGHRAAADHLPQSGAVAAAGDLGGGRADRGAGADLPAGRARRA